jgi:hypothetical protein
MRARVVGGALVALVLGRVDPARSQTSDNPALAYVAVPDLDAALRNLESTLEALSPGRVAPGMLKAGLGGLLGDPALADLTPGEPVAIRLLKPAAPMAPPGIALYLPVVKPGVYQDALARRGLNTKLVGGVLVAAPDEAALASGERELPAYRSLKGAGPKGDVQLLLRLGALLDAYGPALRMALESRQAPGLPAAAHRFMRLQTTVLVSLAAQVEDLRVGVGFAAGALEVETVVTSRPETALADLATMAPAGEAGATRSLPAEGPAIMTGLSRLDPARLSSFVGRVMEEWAKDPDVAGLLTPDVTLAVRGSLEACGGETSFRISQSPATLLLTESASRIADEARCLGTLERMAALSDSAGPFGQLWGSLGLRTRSSLTRDVRRHGGVAVHRIRSEVQGPAEPTDLTKALQDQEVAFTGGYYLASNQPSALDGLIDLARGASTGTGLTVRAAEAFGPSHHLYYDYDVVGFIKVMSAAEPSRFKAVSDLPSAPQPMLFAAGFERGRIRLLTRVPLQPFAQLGKAFSQQAAHPRLP